MSNAYEATWRTIVDKDTSTVWYLFEKESSQKIQIDSNPSTELFDSVDRVMVIVSHTQPLVHLFDFSLIASICTL